MRCCKCNSNEYKLVCVPQGKVCIRMGESVNVSVCERKRERETLRERDREREILMERPRKKERKSERETCPT